MENYEKVWRGMEKQREDIKRVERVYNEIWKSTNRYERERKGIKRFVKIQKHMEK